MALASSLENIRAQLRWLAPLGAVIAASVAGHYLGLGIGLLTLSGSVLGGVIWLIWSSLQGLTGDVPLTLDEALSLGAPSTEEEQKRSVLRALKDLEYERAVGKINDADYAILAEHYRNEAKRLLRAVDADLGPERDRAEQLLAERLAAEGFEPTPEEKPASEPSAEALASEDALDAPVAKSPTSDAAP